MALKIHNNVIFLSDCYIDQAIALLTLPEMDEDAIHDVRVLMKQLRGMVRLYAGLGVDADVEAINESLRDVAKVFSARRDAHVLLDTLHQVASKSEKSVRLQLQVIIEEVAAETAEVMLELAPEKLIEQLESIRQRWQSQLQIEDDELLLNALIRAYRKNRRRGRQALRSRDAQFLHDWRKWVKYLHYQLSALPMPAQWLSTRLGLLRRLGSLLGKVHDLDVLNDYLQARKKVEPELMRVIAKRRVRLVKKIRAIYGQVFHRSGKDFRKKIQAT